METLAHFQWERKTGRLLWTSVSVLGKSDTE